VQGRNDQDLMKRGKNRDRLRKKWETRKAIGGKEQNDVGELRRKDVKNRTIFRDLFTEGASRRVLEKD